MWKPNYWTCYALIWSGRKRNTIRYRKFILKKENFFFLFQLKTIDSLNFSQIYDSKLFGTCSIAIGQNSIKNEEKKIMGFSITNCSKFHLFDQFSLFWEFLDMILIHNRMISTNVENKSTADSTIKWMSLWAVFWMSLQAWITLYFHEHKIDPLCSKFTYKLHITWQ